jgi:hypothetical protein
VVLDKRRVIDSGSHNSLMRQGGHYAQLCELVSSGGICASMTNLRGRRSPIAIAISQEVIHSVRGFPSQFRYDMGIRVHRQPDLRVAQDIHYYSR